MDTFVHYKKGENVATQKVYWEKIIYVNTETVKPVCQPTLLYLQFISTYSISNY